MRFYPLAGFNDPDVYLRDTPCGFRRVHMGVARINWGEAVRNPDSRCVLLLSQGYPPDPTTGGQHLRDIAIELASRGWRVVVMASSRGYNDTRERYASGLQDGVEVCRIPFSSLGKQSIARRLLAGTFFTLQCVLRGMFLARLDYVIVTTAPPISPVGGWLLTFARRVKMTYWVQDLHPDQLVALGRTTERSLFARGMRWINRRVISRSERVVVLDEFMADRVRRYYETDNKLTISRPWAHTDVLVPIVHDDNPERAVRGWVGKRVLLYSGNLGFHTPIDAILLAMLDYRESDDLVLAIAGAGVGVERVRDFAQEHGLKNIEYYPFEPFDRMRFALAAADAHVVSMGSGVNGMIHPNKLYAAMAMSRPVFMLSPRPCYADSIIEPNHIGWHHTHDDVEGVRHSLGEFLSMPSESLIAMGSRGRQLIESCYRKEDLVDHVCDALTTGGRAQFNPGRDLTVSPKEKQ